MLLVTFRTLSFQFLEIRDTGYIPEIHGKCSMQLKYVKKSKEKRMRYGNLNKDLIS